MTSTTVLRDDAPLRRFEYDDGTKQLVADLGVDSDATVEVLDDTAVVATADGQHDVDLPTDDARAFIHNGVVTIDVTTPPEDDA